MDNVEQSVELSTEKDIKIRGKDGRIIKASEADVHNAFYLRQKLVKLQREGIKWYLEIGRVLYEIQTEELYKHMGEGGYDSFREFLSDPEIHFSEATAYKYVSVYKFYVLDHGMTPEELADAPLNRLNVLIPILKDKKTEEVHEEVSAAAAQSESDFQETMKVRKERPKKPEVYLDPILDKYVVKFDPRYTWKIIDINNGDIIFESDGSTDRDQSED